MASAEKQVEQKAATGAHAPFRMAVAAAAKRFKSSWVEFGKLLAKVRNEGLWEDWGYPSFESYCLGELRIKKNTADKLTRNYSFLEKHEPERVQAEDIVQTAPPFEVVEVLAQADARGQLSAEEYKSVRDAIWSNERPVSELRRELGERFPAPAPPEPEASEVLKRLWSQARKLAAEMRAQKQVPRAVVERAEALAVDLEELVARKLDA